MRKVRCLTARGTYAERATLSPPGAAMASRDDQPKGLLRRGSSPACQPGRAGRSRATSWALVLGVLLRPYSETAHVVRGVVETMFYIVCRTYVSSPLGQRNA